MLKEAPVSVRFSQPCACFDLLCLCHYSLGLSLERLHGRTVLWWVAQRPFVNLLSNCFRVGGPGIRALRQLDPVIAKTVAEYTVSCMTVNPKLFLDVKSEVLLADVGFFKEACPAIKIFSIGLLKELLTVTHVGEAFVTQIGEAVVPSGSPGLSGRRFAECFLDCAASLALVEKPASMSNPRIGEKVMFLKAIYVYLSCSLKLREQYLEQDERFNLLEDDARLEIWARLRLSTAGSP